MADYLEPLTLIQRMLLSGALLSGLIGVATAAGFALEASLGSSRRIFDLPRAEGQLRWELVGTLRFIAMAAVSFGWLLSVVAIADESPVSIATTFVGCWLGFEIYYWALHRAMHLRPLYQFHRYHHDSRVTSPLTGYSMSTVESAGWLVGLVGIPYLLSFISPLSLVGFLSYHVLYQVSGNVIGHVNVDFFPAAASNRITSWISHPVTYHSLHHARFNNHYSFGSSFMDRLLGTEWADWPELHARIVGGQPLLKLSARGTQNSEP